MNNDIYQSINDIEERANRVLDLSKYALEIGVFSSKSDRKKKNDITNAELLFIHENGSPLRNLPSRPVLRMACQYAIFDLIPTTVKKLHDMNYRSKQPLTDKQIKVELERMAIRLQNYCRKLIYKNDGTLAANAPSVIKKKGSNHPLFDTGRLARSITCRLIEINSDKQ